MKYLFLPTVLALACAVSACQKDEEKPLTKTERLVAKRWTVSADVVTKIDPVTEQPVTSNVYATYRTCDRDNYLKFDSGNKLFSNQGTAKCDPQAGQQVEGTWSFNEDETRLRWVDPLYGPDTIEAELLELTSTKLVVKFSSGSGNGLVTETRTFTAS